MSSSNDQLLHEMLTISETVFNVEKKKNYHEQIIAAWTTKSTVKMLKVRNDLNAYIFSQKPDDPIIGKTNESPEDPYKPQKEYDPKYTSPPERDQGIRDFLANQCPEAVDLSDPVAQAAAFEVSKIDSICGRKYRDVGNVRVNCNRRDKKSTPGFNTIVNKGVRIVSLQEKIRDKKEMRQVQAPPQSGKSKFMMCSAFNAVLKGISSVVVVRNFKEDSKQLAKRFEELLENINKFLTKHKVVGRFEIKVLKGEKLKQLAVSEIVTEAFNCGTPIIIVCLANPIQIGELHKIATNTSCAFNLYLDEADHIDYGESQVAEYLSDLKRISYQPFLVTATPLDCIFSEAELKASSQIRLSPPANYISLADVRCEILPHKNKKSLSKSSTFEMMCEADQDLIPFLNRYSYASYQYSKFPENDESPEYDFPNICLMKNTSLKDNQIALSNGINERYPEIFTTIVYNGDGVLIQGPNIPKTFEIVVGKKKTMNKTIRASAGKFFKCGISHVLQYLKTSLKEGGGGGFKMHSKIIIISCRLASRSISFVSCDYRWHLTDMYYVPADNTSVTELIQCACRICIVNITGVLPTLHATTTVLTELYHGYHFMDDISRRAIAQPRIDAMNQEMSFRESFLSIPIKEEKIPKRRLTTNETLKIDDVKVKVNRKSLNLIANDQDDGGASLESYKYKLVSKVSKKPPVVKKIPVEKKVVTSVAKVETPVSTPVVESVAKELPEDEFNRLTTVLFPKWAKADTKIARFMKNLDPRKVYTYSEINTEAVNTGIRLSELTKYIRNDAKGYGMILQCEKTKYKLQPCLIKAYNQYF